ncbi:MAG: uracil-DNA glycosylase [Limnohabitans sp.]|nr:uracil-DNA glycosylase [Limnohabitans sp.]
MTDTLHLDKRQRAMLAEMGVRVWSPLTEAAVALAPEVVIQVQAEEAHSFVAASELATQAAPKAASAPIIIQRPEGIDQMDWSTLHSTVSACQACTLCGTRNTTVFGVGAPATPGQAPQVDWLIVGEAPGEQEDLSGQPFVGQAGKLLDNMLVAMQLSRTGERTAEGGGVYIANVLKCHPPGNRNPKPEEVAQCLPYLERQVALLKPKMILAMGRFALQALLRDSVPEVESTPLGKLRGRVYSYQNIPVVVTYHPAYVLRNLPEKAKVWADLCLAMAHVKDTPVSDQG